MELIPFLLLRRSFIICGIEVISHQITSSDKYSLEFETIGRTRMMSIRFWKDDSLVRVQLYRCPLAQGIPASYFAGASRFLSVTSSKPKLVSVSGCSASVVQAIDDSEEFLYNVQYPFRFDPFPLSLPLCIKLKPMFLEWSTSSLS